MHVTLLMAIERLSLREATKSAQLKAAKSTQLEAANFIQLELPQRQPVIITIRLTYFEWMEVSVCEVTSLQRYSGHRGTCRACLRRPAPKART